MDHIICSIVSFIFYAVLRCYYGVFYVLIVWEVTDGHVVDCYVFWRYDFWQVLMIDDAR